MIRFCALPLFFLLFLAACADTASRSVEDPGPPPDVMLEALDSATVRPHIAYLSDDALEGRAPGTRGESLAVAYIAEQMAAAGLEPAGEDGSFFQQVPLVGSTPAPKGPLTFTREDGQTLQLRFVEDFIASTDLTDTNVSTEGELVFAGYGIDAPAYDWDDYKGVDVTGKILVLFVNDPIAGEEEPALFQADTLTYYGRWTYKYEEARRRGARGAILIHTLQTAGYPFTVLSGTAAGEQIQLAAPPASPLALKSWITQESAEQLARMAGTSLEAWFAAANDRNFQPQPLPITAALDVDYAVRTFTGTNVIGKVAGTASPEEAVVYTAHHDHLGIGRPVAGDSIYNGAVDNATGVGMMLTLAGAFALQPEKPRRTVLFLSVTAEESGLLGAEHYVRHPVVPLGQTVANINLDSGNIYGETEDIVGIGAERSDLGRLLEAAAAAEQMRVTPDPRPNQGSFFRSDQLAFARAGVPGVFINTGRSFRGQPADYFERVVDAYNRQHYHQPSDAFDPTWPTGGLVQQMRVAGRIGYTLAYGTQTPQWRPGEGFGEARQRAASADGPAG